MRSDDYKKHYKILEELGEGENGVVHRAIHKITREPVAIKFYDKSYCIEEDALVKL